MVSNVAMTQFHGWDREPIPTEQQVVAVVLNGDVEAFGVLVDRYYGALARLLTYRLGDRDVALDLTQETFADAFRDLETFKGRGTFSAWLYGIAHNRLRMYWRGQRVRRLISLEWLVGSTEATPLSLQEADGSEPCLERDVFSQVLDGLNPPLRDALLLHDLDGFTAPEVSGILHISRAAAERRISRAKEQFRARYHELNDERIHS